MVRKTRRMITKEIFNIVKNMLESENNKVKCIARTVGISVRTVSNIYNKIISGNTFETFREKHIKSAKLKATQPNTVNLIINNFVSCKNDVTLSEIKEEIIERTGLQISLTTISRKLKQLGISRKKLSLIPEERNSQRIIEERCIFAAEITRIHTDNLVFLDESGINLHNCREYGYSAINFKAYKTVSANRGRNLSIIAVVDLNGLVAYEMKRSPYNSEAFINFISNNLVSYFNNNPSKVLVMDNARFHHSQSVITFLREKRIPFKYLPAYSPQLNPIEEFFSMMKQRYYEARERHETIENALSEVLSNDFSLHCQGFYRNMVRWLENARQQKEFI